MDSVRDPMVAHVGRVLVLIDVFTGRSAALEGLRKLARLDFILRYPVVLEAVLQARGKPLSFDLRPTQSEYTALETANLRWKYGPWDHRYYPILGQLVGRRLVQADATTGRLRLRSTAAGRGVATALDDPAWNVIRDRAKALKSGANLSATTLTALVTPLLEDRS